MKNHSTNYEIKTSLLSRVQYIAMAGSQHAGLLGNFLRIDRRLAQFEAGERTQDIFIPIVSDEVAEGDESFLILLSTTGDEVTLGAPLEATVTIIDDD